ncbi:MAG TPA: hypothetical protein P5060_01680 [Candidatus Absconditabacterales bacterium]|nr:hypothetical protein [Candidatus Absconditabacterales bacterium]
MAIDQQKEQTINPTEEINDGILGKIESTDEYGDFDFSNPEEMINLEEKKQEIQDIIDSIINKGRNFDYMPMDTDFLSKFNDNPIIVSNMGELTSINKLFEKIIMIPNVLTQYKGVNVIEIELDNYGKISKLVYKEIYSDNFLKTKKLQTKIDEIANLDGDPMDNNYLENKEKMIGKFTNEIKDAKKYMNGKEVKIEKIEQSLRFSKNTQNAMIKGLKINEIKLNNKGEVIEIYFKEIS